MTKEEAILFVLKVLRSSMALTSKPTRDQALEAAKQHNITATELIEKQVDLIWKT